MPAQLRQEDNFPAHSHSLIRFDRYQIDVRSGELRKEGRKIRLQAQPFQLLVLLLRNPGRVVSREDVRQELWPGDTFVDFDHGLAAAVNKIRDALCDSAEKPKFIETLPRRGYRFIGKLEPDPPVEIRTKLEEVPAYDTDAERVYLGQPAQAILNSRTQVWTARAALAFVTAAVIVGFMLLHRRTAPEVQTQQWTLTQFTSYPGATISPAFSPDGSRIAFGWDAKAGNEYDLYVKALGGETLLRLTHHPSEWISAVWSPDGTEIALMRIAGADTGLYVVPALGGPEQKLLATHTPYDLAAPISWSPDGKWIAYADQPEATTGSRMYLYSSETRQSHAFFHDPTCPDEANLLFSNSGTQVAWFCVRKRDEIEVMIGDSAGRARRVLRAVPLAAVGLSWSPDDSKLITSQIGPAKGELYEIAVSDGSMKRPPAGAGETSAIWPVISGKTGAIAWNAWRYKVDLARADLRNPKNSRSPILESPGDGQVAPLSQRQDYHQDIMLAEPKR